MSDSVFIPAQPAGSGDAAVDPAAPQPDSTQVEAFMAQAFGHVVVLIEQIAGTVPQLHSLTGRVAAMRAAYDAAVFHASPPAP